MQFQRLRLAGFKSFVEPTEFRIEPGLTGVVGPNGCGKSNLLEALRWVMGASSAKSLRADGMDEVIFGGSDARAARSHAEVRLEIDNTDGGAPAPWSGEAVIEVVRRIDRGAGSSYRVNGGEARARDVQILFADGSTGANSPSLVRQGQISELIAAKPSNRRRLLEEAAGVAGLHGRRQEAGLRLSAAEANLARLGDVLREVDAGLARLRREARQAETYRRRSARIRLVQLAALHARWSSAEAAWTAADADAATSLVAVAETAREAARTATSALERAAAMPRLREELAIAAAVLQPLAIERDRIERELASAHASRERLEQERRRLQSDLARERRLAADAGEAAHAADLELRRIGAALAEPDRIPALESELRDADAARACADRHVEDLVAAAAAQVARRDAEQARREALNSRRADAERRASQSEARLQARRADADKALVALQASRSAAAPDLAGLSEARTLAEDGRAQAYARLEAAERALTDADTRAAAAKAIAQTHDDELRRLQAEASGLAQLVQRAPGGGGAVLECVTARPGFENALAAALGDDLEAGLDAGSAAYWTRRDPPAAPLWPPGATPLRSVIEGPPQLDIRLAFTAIVGRDEGGDLAQTLAPGARLVSRDGDLWRWDGFVSRAGSPRPAARRLEQRSRLVAIEAEMSRLAPRVQATRDEAMRTATLADDARRELAGARDLSKVADAAVAPRRAELERGEREVGLIEVRRAAAEEAHRRAAELAEAAEREHARDKIESDAAVAAVGEPLLPESTPPGASLADARVAADGARGAERAARAARDDAHRRREGCRRRAAELRTETGDWTHRAVEADARCASLDVEFARATTALDAVHGAPAAAAARLSAVDARTAQAEARRLAAIDALAEAEAALLERDRTARAAEAAAGSARERRAAALATLASTEERRDRAKEDLVRAADASPAEVAARLAEHALAIPTDPDALDAHLRTLEAERTAQGVVNLRAEEDLAEHTARRDAMMADIADLTAAAAKLRTGVDVLNAEGRDRVLAAFTRIDDAFRDLFSTLFDGGHAELRLVESDDALEAGLEIFACPPGKRLSTMSLMSGGEQALTACALIFAVFLSNPSPVCVLDEVDAPLDDANVDRFCRLLDEMRRRTSTRFITITHNPVTMSRMDRLVGVTMAERGVSQMVSVDLARAAALVEA